MPNTLVFARISNKYYELTASEKKVADFVMSQQRKTQYMSISELAEACGVAEATITRFCHSLDYKGFSAFKLAVANSTASRAAASPLSGEVLPEDSIENMCQKLCNTDMEAISSTRELIVPDDLRRAADVLLAADSVMCMGQGGSMIMAEEAAHLLSTAYRGCYAISDSHIQAMRATQLTERDAVLYFSYSGATKDLLEILTIVRKTGAKVILVTRFRASPASALADIVLVCGSNETPLQLGSVAAKIAQLYLMDALFSEMCRRDEELCKEVREKIADALSEKHI